MRVLRTAIVVGSIGVLSSTAFAQSLPSPPPGTTDTTWLNGAIVPDPHQVNDCRGNCGAGCGDFLAVCGGDQNWTYDMLAGPSGPNADYEIKCDGSSVYVATHYSYNYLVRWSYHGEYSTNCAEHDNNCNGWLGAWDPACWISIATITAEGPNWCSDATPHVWSYAASATARTIYADVNYTGQGCWTCPTPGMGCQAGDWWYL